MTHKEQVAYIDQLRKLLEDIDRKLGADGIGTYNSQYWHERIEDILSKEK